MKKIDELDFSSLKVLSFLVVPASIFRSARRFIRARWIIIIFACLLLVAVYFYAKSLNDLEYLSWLNTFVEIVLYGLIIWLVVYLFKDAINYDFTRNFIKQNDLTILDQSTNLPPLVAASKQFQSLGQYSFRIRTFAGYDVDVVQFCTINRRFVLFPKQLFISMCVELPSRKYIPHVYLDNVNNGSSFLKVFRQQSLKLESIFPKKYRLYHEKNMETEVRELFTPDVMQAFLELREAFDFEFLDNRLWLIAQGLRINEHDLREMLQTIDFLVSEIEK